MKIKQTKLDDLIPYASNSRTHSEEHWDAATNSAMCYTVAIAALRVELLKERAGETISHSEGIPENGA
jgi:hypothetical protein